MTTRDYVMLGDEAYDSQTGEIIQFRPKRFVEVERAVIAATKWNDMRSAETLQPGAKVWLRLDDGHHLGGRVTGWRAIATDGSVYYTYDKANRRHITVNPIGWALLQAIGPGVA